MTPRCRACEADLPSGAKFCPQCGGGTGSGPAVTPRSERRRYVAGADRVAERRVTSVLFGDLVGFTALSEGRDPEEVRELLSTYFDQCRNVVGRYGGTIEKFIGDAVMAVWGVPTTTDEDAERAVRAGLDLIAVVRSFGSEHGAPELAMRVGVVTGEVAVTLGATGEGMVAGDAVNTASRVQALAPANRLWVDEQTRVMSSDAVRYRDAGEHTVKGKALPLALHEAVSIASETTTGVAVPLIGYHREIALLKNEFHAARASASGRMLLLVGEPGVGKTRLGNEFEDFTDGLPETVRWHRGRCLAYGDGVAYSALVGAVRGRIGADDGDDPAALREKLGAGVERWTPDPDEAAWITPRLEALLGLGTGSFERDDLFAAWLTWFERIGADGSPVVWVVDDLHAADDAFLDLLDHLVRSVRVPLFVVGLARPELFERHPTLVTGRRTTTVQLAGLPRREMDELFDALIGGLDPETRSRLVDQAAGMPLYAIETVRALIDRGLTEERGGALTLLPDADPAQILDPATTAGLQVLIASRLDMLGPERRALLQDAAVLGQTFSADVLAVASGRDVAEIEAMLDEMVSRDLLSLIRDKLSSEDGKYAFVQSPVRQVAYQMLSRRDRRQRHLAAADALEPMTEAAGELTTVVAQHLLDALRLTDPDDAAYAELLRRATSWQVGSAERMRALGALDDALAAYERIIATTQDPAEVVALRLVAADIAYDIGRHETVIAHANAVIESPTAGPTEMASARTRASYSLRTVGRSDAALEVLAPYARADDLDGLDDVTASGVAGARSAAHLELGDFEEWRRWGDLALLRAEATGDPRTIYLALNGIALGDLAQRAPTLEAAILDACLQLARRHGLRRELIQALVNRSDELICVDPTRAREYALEALELGLASGMQALSAFAQTNLMLVHHAVGEWDALMETSLGRPASDGLDDQEKLHDFATVVWLRNLVSFARGGPETAPTSWDVVDLDGGGQRSFFAIAHQALLTMMRGEDARGVDLCVRALENGAVAGLVGEEVHLVWTLAIDRALAGGQVALARDILARDEELRVVKINTRHVAERRRLAAAVAAADPESDPAVVESELTAAITVLDAWGAVPTRARAEATLGCWLRSHGRDDEAQPLLASARQTFTELEATAWLAEFGLDR